MYCTRGWLAFRIRVSPSPPKALMSIPGMEYSLLMLSACSSISFSAFLEVLDFRASVTSASIRWNLIPSFFFFRRKSAHTSSVGNGGLSGLFLSVFPEYSFIFRRLSGTFPQDFSVQYPPHMLRISVQIRQLQYIHPRCLFCDLRQGNSCKSNAAVFDLFQYFAFRTQFCFTLHDDVDPSSGTLLHQFCKTSALPSAASECH